MKQELLVNQLCELEDSDFYPFHMPGHKRQIKCQVNPYAYDITEITEFDNLHHAKGVLKRLQDAWANQCKSTDAYLLVNGSSGGILSSIYASTREGDQVLIARNSHKSVYHAANLRHLKVSYLYPEQMKEGINGPISAKQVREAFSQNPEIKAVVITSPTYDGINSDIEAISQIVHANGAILIVDCAHGAHFGLHESFPEAIAMKMADLCVISLHKTLPSPTQSALLLRNHNRVSDEAIKEALGIFETSSPSYVMMAAMELCLGYCEDTKENRKRLDAYYQNLTAFYDGTKELKCLRVYQNADKNIHDRTKILIFTNHVKDYSGEDLLEELREVYHLELEMAAVNYAIALSSFMDTKEGLVRLKDALCEIDKRLMREKEFNQEYNASIFPKANAFSSRLYLRREKVYEIYEAEQMETEEVSIKEASGRISGEFAYLYPPGIPIITKGEKIPEYFAEEISKIKDLKLEINGLANYQGTTIKVLKIG